MYDKANGGGGSQIDVLVIFILKTCPGSIRLFKELGPVVESLMVREVQYDLRQTLLNKKDGPFGEQNLAQVFEDDKHVLASQRIELPWEIVDSKAAEEGLPKF
ncbi:serine-proline rich protein [Penicillium angulare]|uniref:serine-proline rich protein n=1 Tax=Penicillium angulare TaxID=116970 RepID=UPI0025409B74|nr:serine-proline rich protein [Penicillium angulare]KAJ5259342.1 serine-proline rich protein [Penicillium angulare]